MRYFLGWPGAKSALGLGGLSDRNATLAVWTILQVELAFVAPLYTVSKALRAPAVCLRRLAKAWLTG